MKKRRLTIAAILTAALAFPLSSEFADDLPTIPAGTSLQVRLTVTVSSKANENGDPWVGNVVEPVFAGGYEAIPPDSRIEGRISFLKPPGRGKGVAEMRLTAEKIITPDGVTYSVSAGLQDAQGPEGTKVADAEGTIQGPRKDKKGAAKETAVAAGAGAGVGAITRGGKGALYGAAIGAAAAVIHTIAKHHPDIVLPQGTELTFSISRPLTGKKAPQAAETQK